MYFKVQTFFRSSFRLTLIALQLVSFSVSIASPLHDAANVGDISKAQQVVANDTESIDAKNDRGLTPLILAVQSGKREFTEWLLLRGANVNAKASDFTTPLHWAAQQGKDDIVRLLLSYKADVNSINNGGQTPLHCAASSSPSEDTLRLLIASGADVNARDVMNHTPLLGAVMEMRRSVLEILITNGAVVDVFSAAALGDQKLVQDLLMSDKSVLSARQNGLTLLHLAAAWGQAEMSAFLISKGLDVNVVTPETGTTPLHTAASFGRTNVVKILLQKGSLAEVRSFNGQTALHLASERGHEGCVAMLLDSGANLDARDNQGRTALYLAASGGRGEVIKLLLSKKANSNISSFMEDSPLHIAVKAGNLQIVQYLLNAGAQVDARDSKGQTSLHCATYLTVNETNLLKLLLDFGANINAKDKYRNSPLHLATKYNTPTVVGFLLAKKADVNAWNWKGETPMSFLLSESRPTEQADEVVRILTLQGGHEYSYAYRVFFVIAIFLLFFLPFIGFRLVRHLKQRSEK